MPPEFFDFQCKTINSSGGLNPPYNNATTQRRWTMIIKIEHFGYGFRSNENAVLIATDIRYHHVFLK